MSGLDRLGVVRETDVLIIGGGIAGLAAAITTKEKSPETRVLVVDKNFSGWAGQANKGAGIFMFLGPDDPVDRFLDYHTHNIGMFLEDQLLLGEFAAKSLATIEKLDSWCHTFCRDADGTLATDTFKPGLPWRLAAAEMVRPGGYNIWGV